MSSRRCADPRRAPAVSAVATLAAMLGLGCSVFGPPSTDSDAGVMDAGDDGQEPSLDGGHDAAVPERDAGDVADASHGDGDGDGDDAGLPPEEIPVRPALTSCGFAAPTTVTTVAAAVLDEVSGLAISRRHAGVFWMIEDSGNGASVHAVNTQGALIASYAVPGTVVDYEDIAIGPGPESDTDYLYIAD